MSGHGAGRFTEAMGRQLPRVAGKGPVTVPMLVSVFRSSIPRNSMSTAPRPDTGARLSTRELEVATMVGQGLTNREIAAKLFISERTVDGHLEHIREKLGVNTRAQVATWLVRQEAAQAAPVPQRTQVPRWTLAHPRMCVAAALVSALLAAAARRLRTTPRAPPTIVTFAGSDCLQNSCPAAGDYGRATEAKLTRPTSIAVDSKGIVYIADFGNGRIRKVD